MKGKVRDDSGFWRHAEKMEAEARKAQQDKQRPKADKGGKKR